MMDKISNSSNAIQLQTQPKENPAASEKTEAQGAPKKGKRAADGKDASADFVSQLSQAGMALEAKSASPTSVQSVPEKGAGLKKEQSQLGANSSLERSPETQKAAASSNTATAIAGLKPWSKDWVFMGDDDKNSQVKPLISTSEKSPLEKLKGLASETRGEVAAAGSHSLSQIPSAQARPKSAVPPQVAGSGWSMQPIKEDKARDAALNPELASQISALNGMLDELRVSDEKGAPKGPSKGTQYSGLSGAEFVNTLGAAKNSKSDAQMGSDSGAWNQGSPRQGGLKVDSRPELKVIKGGLKDKRSAFDGEALASSMAGPGAHLRTLEGRQPKPPTEVTGHVVKGSMARDRLSHEALLGVANGIKGASQVGGGEIRIRLKPENLGELHLRVVAQGNTVGLQIQASDDRAKKVLEDSISHLKESLASQRLTLAQVEVSVNQPQNASSGGNMGDDSGRQYGNQGFQDLVGQNQNQSNQGRSSNPWASSDLESGAMRASPMRARAESVAVDNYGSGSADRMSRWEDSQGNWRLDVKA